jgi:hypothetical protein
MHSIKTASLPMESGLSWATWRSRDSSQSSGAKEVWGGVGMLSIGTKS